MTELLDDELNKRVHEIMGLCWHEWKTSCGDMWCKKCKINHVDWGVYNLITWESFGMMFEFMQQHERWEEFLEQYGWKSFSVDSLPDGKSFIKTSLISPRPFAEAMVRFFEEIKS